MNLGYKVTTLLPNELYQNWVKYRKYNNATNEILIGQALTIMKTLPKNFGYERRDRYVGIETRNRELYEKFQAECRRTGYTMSAALRMAARELTEEEW